MKVASRELKVDESWELKADESWRLMKFEILWKSNVVRRRKLNVGSWKLEVEKSGKMKVDCWWN